MTVFEQRNSHSDLGTGGVSSNLSLARFFAATNHSFKGWALLKVAWWDFLPSLKVHAQHLIQEFNGLSIECTIKALMVLLCVLIALRKPG